MRKRGFTLIEMLIVVCVIGIIATIVVSAISGIGNRNVVEQFEDRGHWYNRFSDDVVKHSWNCPHPNCDTD